MDNATDQCIISGGMYIAYKKINYRRKIKQIFTVSAL